MPLINVTDPSDPRLAPYCRLTDAQLRSRLDPSQGIVVCESEIAVRQALESGMEPLSLLVTERRLGALAGLIAKAGEAASGPLPTYVLPDAVAERLTGYRLHRGVLCVLRRPPELAPERAVEGAQRACVLDALVDVSNVGAVFRSAAALGVDAVLGLAARAGLRHGCACPHARRHPFGHGRPGGGTAACRRARQRVLWPACRGGIGLRRGREDPHVPRRGLAQRGRRGLGRVLGAVPQASDERLAPGI